MVQQEIECHSQNSFSPYEEKYAPKAQLISSLKSILFILLTPLVIFVAFSNTLMWHLQHFWGASGNFWQSQWNKICHLFGDDNYAISVWGTFLVTMSVYWGFGAIYTIIDLTGKPAFLLRLKIQENAPYPVDTSRIYPVIKQVVINQIIFGFPALIFGYYLMEWRGCDFGNQLPTFQRFLCELLICIIVEEIGFYYSHRLLHHPQIYKHIHKRHHEWTAPIAITAMYCHPIEYLFSNYGPAFLGPLLLGSHTSTAWVWFSIAIFNTLNAHCGYNLPFFVSPESHDFHHLQFNQNYGALGILDRLHNTDALFRKKYRNHVAFLNLVPIKRLYLDDSKEKK